MPATTRPAKPQTTPYQERLTGLRASNNPLFAVAEQIAKVVGSIRNIDLKKAPSISETIDWARTLIYLGRNEITPEVMGETLHVLLKYQTDITKARKELGVDSPAGARK